MTADSKNKLSLPRESLDGREGKIRVLNLYAGIGGNRKLWQNVKVTAVEIDKDIAAIYQKQFPNDDVIIADAHEFLLKHFEEFDFIWSSPPCQSHSVTNFFLKGYGIRRYPDMKLYEEIIFLKANAKCKWVVENVISYYEALIKPYVLDGHYFWSNFVIGNKPGTRNGIAYMNTKELAKERKIDVDLPPKIARQVLRNCVLPGTGLKVFNMAFNDKQKSIKEMIV